MIRGSSVAKLVRGSSIAKLVGMPSEPTPKTIEAHAAEAGERALRRQQTFTDQGDGRGSIVAELPSLMRQNTFDQRGSIVAELPSMVGREGAMLQELDAPPQSAKEARRPAPLRAQGSASSLSSFGPSTNSTPKSESSFGGRFSRMWRQDSNQSMVSSASSNTPTNRRFRFGRQDSAQSMSSASSGMPHTPTQLRTPLGHQTGNRRKSSLYSMTSDEPILPEDLEICDPVDFEMLEADFRDRDGYYTAGSTPKARRLQIVISRASASSLSSLSHGSSSSSSSPTSRHDGKDGLASRPGSAAGW